MPNHRTPDRGRILVTRPAHQAGPLCQRLQDRGYRILRFPAIDIAWRNLDQTEESRLRAAAEQDLLLFTSINAVEGFRRLLARRDLPLPCRVAAAAIGTSTAAALEAIGFDQVLAAPAPFTSEALLDLPELRALAERPVMLVTGEGGRGLIAERLRLDGVRLSILPVYRRVLPDISPEPLLRALQEDDVQLSIVTSGEALTNLEELLGPKDWSRLQAVPLLTVSQRLAEKARQAGFSANILISPAGDAALARAVVGWSEQITRGGHAHER